MSIKAFINRLNPGHHLMIAGVLIVGSGLLLWGHAGAVRDMREIGLPAAVALPHMEKRIALLQEQNEIAEVQAEVRGGSQEDLLHLYVIPEEDDIDRLLATFDVVFSYMEQKRLLKSFSDITVGEREDVSENLAALPITFEADLTDDGLKQLLTIIDFSGLLTVSDLLSQDDIDMALALTERENPAAIAALEQFLGTDLLRYAEEPKSYEEQLKKSFVSPASETALMNFFQSDHLRAAKDRMNELGPILRSQKMWPSRLLTVDAAAYRDVGNGIVHASVKLKAYVRVR